MLRAGYTAPCRFFRDSEEVGVIRWYRCAPDAPPLGYESAISSTQQRGPQWLGSPVGEVFPFEFAFDYGDPVDGINYEHVCGQEVDFVEGGRYLPDEEPVLYLENGLPECCFGQPGGVGLGGAMRVHRDEGVGLDGSMHFVKPGVPANGLGLVPLDTLNVHLPTFDYSGIGYLPGTGFPGGTYRIDWFQTFPFGPPSAGTFLVWRGTHVPGFIPEATSFTFPVMYSAPAATSGSVTLTFPAGQRPVITVGQSPAPPPQPPRPTRAYWFTVTRLSD